MSPIHGGGKHVKPVIVRQQYHESSRTTVFSHLNDIQELNTYLKKNQLQESQENVARIEGLQPFSTYVIQVAVKNYYSDPLEHLLLGKEIQGKTKSGGEFMGCCGFIVWDSMICVLCVSVFFI